MQMVGRNVGFAFVTCLIIFLCIAWGGKWTGRIAFATIGIPVTFVLVFLDKALTLEGAYNGITEYIGIWDMIMLRTEEEV